MASNRKNSVRPSGWFSTDGLSPVARRKANMPLSSALLIPCPQKVRMSSVENVPERKYALAGVST
jgi:hypothetical protein